MFASSSSVFTRQLPDLQTYTVNFSLKRLTPGVDNVHYDVHISPKLQESTKGMVSFLLARHSNASEIESLNKDHAGWNKERDRFQTICADVLKNAVTLAKVNREYQVDYLAQSAVTKMVMDEIRRQFDELVEQYKSIIRKHEVTEGRSLKTVILLKEELTTLQSCRKRITSEVAGELFRFINEIQVEEIQNIRESIFGSSVQLPADFFSNPILNAENSTSDLFLMDAYVLFGNRLNDPIKYTPIIDLLFTFLHRVHHKEAKINITDSNSKEEMELLNGFINREENFDILFNYKDLQDQIEKKQNILGKEELNRLRSEMKARKNRLVYIQKKIQSLHMMDCVTASFAMKEVYQDYCPPLTPLEVLKFIVFPKERGEVVGKLKRLKGGESRSISLKPLLQVSRILKKQSRDAIRQYLLRFLKGIARYHRDLFNYNLLKEGMNWVHLTNDSKTLRLSRVNRTLYEFLHSSEIKEEEKPVVNHVILKSDVRGSTDITHQIKERGLNPASYFSFNFFDPITEILDEYGSSKVFIEGDAIILSIFEKEDTPKDWYSVARACGLAINILMITQRYNAKSKKHRLPILEQGIGICYRNTPPTYLFDGDKPIMISPAINRADRLSGCSKSIRRKIVEKKLPFNLYVYQTEPDEEMNDTADDLFSRYNVNGIELNAEGFKKLQEEINLQKIRCHAPDIQKDKFVVYTGTFPTISGKYQRLVVREAEIPMISSDTLEEIRMTGRKYYEVCTNRKLYEFIKNVIH